MLARHHGQIVLVSGAIPGERVSARVERSGKGVVFAEAEEIVSASSDRREGSDWRCGGSVFAHIGYARQLRLKGEIIQDAFGRIARHPLAGPVDVTPSPEDGYRMRARLHAHGDRLGFYREGSHDLCDAAATRQLLPSTGSWIAEAQRTIVRFGLRGLAAIELAENIPGDQRACHLELQAGVDPAPFAALGESLIGLSAERADRAEVVRLSGTPAITDTLRSLRLSRDVRAFFQGNRFLLEPLANHVVALVTPAPVVDLYAGVGLFGLSLAAAGASQVTLVEGDPISGADLQANAQPFAGRATVERQSVETFLTRTGRHEGATFIVDPPRTGLSKDALAGVIRATPHRVVYVSCDVATLARDSRALIDAGYDIDGLTAFDLFPNTAHVETVAVFVRES
jgi:tRNA/tmRNA/rRNA uracil-C5-methylase (TrmA/RlmC/RlmD family)